MKPWDFDENAMPDAKQQARIIDMANVLLRCALPDGHAGDHVLEDAGDGRVSWPRLPPIYFTTKP